MLDIIRHLLVLALVHMSHIIIKLLNILPLQFCVTFLLIILYNFCKGKAGNRKEMYLGTWDTACPKHETLTLTRDDEVIEILH